MSAWRCWAEKGLGAAELFPSCRAPLPVLSALKHEGIDAVVNGCPLIPRTRLPWTSLQLACWVPRNRAPKLAHLSSLGSLRQLTYSLPGMGFSVPGLAQLSGLGELKVSAPGGGGERL